MVSGGSFSDDLAIGAPGEDVGTAADAGAVNLVEGTDAGLRPGALYLQGHPERGDRLGSSLTINHFLADSGADLAVGAPGETVNGVAGAGAVSLFDGNATAPGRERLLYVDLGPNATVGGARGAGAASIIYSSQYFEHERLLWQGHAGIGGTPEPGDAFGAAVA